MLRDEIKFLAVFVIFSMNYDCLEIMLFSSFLVLRELQHSQPSRIHLPRGQPFT